MDWFYLAVMHFYLVSLLVFIAANLAPVLEGARQTSGSPDCATSNAGEFSVCAEESIGSGESGGWGGAEGPKMRECKYFANGTIDVPTMTIITAWVAVGSRLCIGDEIPKASSNSGVWRSQAETELRDRFTAIASRPIASWTPGGEVEFGDPIELLVQADTEVVSGTLLGRGAQIRFRPVSARWDISNGADLYGFQKSHSFNAPGSFTVRAYVRYEVDYKHTAGTWVFNAASWEIGANKLAIVVIEKERRTLLVG